MRGLSAVVLPLMFLATVTIARGQADPNSIGGVWESDEKDVRMEYFRDGDHYSGRLLWGNKIVEADNVTSKKDIKNPDPSMRTRDIIGITSLTGLKWNGKEFSDGKIYDPPSGKTYSCKAWMDQGKLHLRGFLGFSMMGKTVTWHRYTPSKP